MPANMRREDSMRTEYAGLYFLIMEKSSDQCSPSRRDKFRSHMRVFNPTAPAMEMIRSGYVIEALHSDIDRHLAGRADLEPGCRQVVAGGIGSEKGAALLDLGLSRDFTTG
jgi:hypothetical protein